MSAASGRPIVVSVLRSGGDFRAEHVARLQAQVALHAPEAGFLCLSDDAAAPRRVPLRHGWPGWWAKLEAFGVLGPVLYLDLDSSVVAPLAPLFEVIRAAEFVALRDFGFPAASAGRTLASGVMGWRGDLSRVRALFAAEAERHMAENATARWWGDGGFLERHAAGLGLAPVWWQDAAPGAVVSFKHHCRDGVPAGARVVAFHGRPRPWEIGAA